MVSRNNNQPPKIPKHKLNTPHSVGVLKKKSRLVSTRLGEEDAKILEEITREESIVKATLIRKWILSRITLVN